MRPDDEYAKDVLLDLIAQEPDITQPFGSDKPDVMQKIVSAAKLCYNDERYRAEYHIRIAGGLWVVTREADYVWHVTDPSDELHEVKLGKLWKFIEKSINAYQRRQRPARPPKAKTPGAAPSTVTQARMDLD